MKVHDFIHGQVSDLAYKVRGIGHLFSGFSPDAMGDDDEEKIRGVGELLEGLGQQMAETALLLELAEDDLMDLELNFRKYEHNQLSEAIRQVEAAKVPQKERV